MRTIVVANPAAGGGRVGRRWPSWQRKVEQLLGEVDVRFTDKPGSATEITRRALLDGFERIAVVGGDGTFNEVVNGFVAADGERLLEGVLALIPVGTGGDFARSIGLYDAGLEEAFASATVHAIDLGRAELTGHDGRPFVRHFINISSFGSSGLIVDMVNRTTKRFGAKASFLWGTVRGLVQYENQRIRLRIDDTFDEEVVINVVAVANGRYFGGSMKIAPRAQLDDGGFDVVVVGDVGLGTFLRMSRKLYRGEHLGAPCVQLLSGRVVKAEPLGDSRVLVDLDGEQPGMLPARYELLPAAINLLAPWHHAEAGTPEAAPDCRVSGMPREAS